MAKIIKRTTYDLRFPTSDHLDGSDAMNPDPDYSAAYVIIISSALVTPSLPKAPSPYKNALPI